MYKNKAIFLIQFLNDYNDYILPSRSKKNSQIFSLNQNPSVI